MDDFKQIEKWTVTKTEIMICGSKPKLRNIQIESISIDSDPIDISDHVRNLGFFLDKHLNMNEMWLNRKNISADAHWLR